MNYLKNESGKSSVFLLILALLLLAGSVYFCLDIFEIISVPKEYSLTQFLETSEETIYQGESGEGLDNNGERNVAKRRVKTDSNEPLTPTDVVSNDNNGVKDNSSDYTRYYYSQLENEGKIIYDKIIENIDNMKTGDYNIDFGKTFNDLLNSEGGDQKLNDCFNSALNALLLDNPNVFYLDITKMFLLTKSTTYPFAGTVYEISIGVSSGESYLNKGFSNNNINSAISDLESKEKEIAKEASGSDLDKIKYVHDYIINNLEYDSSFTNKNIYNSYGGLINNLAVCEGYAKSFKAIMDMLDIPCVIVCGTAQNSNGETENHAWNYVKVNSRWYAIDCTWDDPIVIGGGRLSEQSKYKYYLKGYDTISSDHTEDGVIVQGAYFNYPHLCREDYE